MTLQIIIDTGANFAAHVAGVHYSYLLNRTCLFAKSPLQGSKSYQVWTFYANFLTLLRMMLYRLQLLVYVMCLAIQVNAENLQTDLFSHCTTKETESWEFQTVLDTKKFTGPGDGILEPQGPACYFRNALELLRDFLYITNNRVSIEEQDSPKQEVFEERSWYLLYPNPLPKAPSYVRVRQTREVNGFNESDAVLSGLVKTTATLKFRDVDPLRFELPEDRPGLSEKLECDIHATLHRLTYKQKAKNLQNVVSFDRYWKVLEQFPFAVEVFRIARNSTLPKRSVFFAYRCDWKRAQIDETDLSCTLDIRFESEVAFRNCGVPIYGEFSCKLKAADVDDIDIPLRLRSLAEVFTEYQMTSDWAKPIPVV